ncbi:MAG: rod shape-determining protein MreD [Thermomicrobiales bacterium]
MGRFLFALLLLSATLFQSSFLQAIDGVEVVPNIALVLLLVWSASHSVEEGLIWAFALGLWFDLLTLDPLGIHAIPLMIVALGGWVVSGRLFRSGAILPIVAVVAVTIAAGFVGIMFDVLSGERVLFLGQMRLLLVTAFLNALFVPLIYIVVLIIERVTPSRVS